jgi:hypothetical protein
MIGVGCLTESYLRRVFLFRLLARLLPPFFDPFDKMLDVLNALGSDRGESSSTKGSGKGSLSVFSKFLSYCIIKSPLAFHVMDSINRDKTDLAFLFSQSLAKFRSMFDIDCKE